MSFRLVPKSVTLNDLEWCNGVYFAWRYFTKPNTQYQVWEAFTFTFYFTEFGSFRGSLHKSG